MEKVDEWNRFPGPGPLKAPVWISPEVILTNTDVAKAWVQNTGEKSEVGILLTEEGALELARLTKSHVGENVAVMINGRITAIPKIIAEITGGRAVIQGNFTEGEARLVAEGITAQ
jgi:preprotein translocase subunit SecD